MDNEMIENDVAEQNEMAKRVESLFKFIQQLNMAKQKPVFDANKHRLCIWGSELLDDPEHIKVFYRDRTSDEDGDEYTSNDEPVILLSVQKQDFHKCPAPPESLEDWLKDGWDDYRLEVEHYDELPPKYYNEPTGDAEEITVEFQADPLRITDFDTWLSDRKIWQAAQKRITKSNELFATLYGEYYALKHDGETHELIIANGVFCDAKNKEVCHPILTHRAKLEFMADENTMYICDTESMPELYTDILQGLDDVNLQEINDLREKLIAEDYHPLDRNETPEFLKVLIRRLSSSGLYSNDGIPDKWEQNNRFLLYNEPCFFIRKKLDGTIKAIEKINEAIQEGAEIPKTLIDLVKGGKIDVPQDDHTYTIEEHLAMIGGESVDILLSKPANREQLEIAQRIERYNAVLVQGPPGTGKTHTIANLLGYFIAQGKSVLVTSHTTKALSVLKDKIEGNLQNLCVSLLDDSNKDMEESIEGITDYMARNSSITLKRDMDEMAAERKSIIRRLAEVRKKIFLNIQKECGTFVYRGESITPSEAAKFIADNQDRLNYIPGKVHPGALLPLSFEELVDLYRSNELISETDARELSCELPSLDEIMPANSFEEICKTVQLLEEGIDKYNSSDILSVDLDTVQQIISFSISGHNFAIAYPESESVHALRKYCYEHENIKHWQRAVVTDGNAGGGFRDRWLRLIDQIRSVIAVSAEVANKGLGVDVEFAEDIFLADIIEPLQKVRSMYEANGKLPLFFSIRYGDCDRALKLVRVAGKVPDSAEACLLAVMHIKLQMARNKCSSYWKELLVPYGIPDFEQLGSEPERVAEKYIGVILHYLDWSDARIKIVQVKMRIQHDYLMV